VEHPGYYHGTKMTRKPIVTVVSRPETCTRVDRYAWITGSDRLPHKIGFWDGSAIVEKIDDTVVRLTDSEREYFNRVIHNNSKENK
jgi:hypothetical protein